MCIRDRAGLARRHVGRQQLLDQQCSFRQRLDLGLRKQRRELVTKTHQAGGFEPDDPRALCHEGRQRIDRPLCLSPRLVDQSGRKEGAPAAERPPSVLCDDAMQTIAAGLQHALRRLQVLALEIAVSYTHLDVYKRQVSALGQ